LFRGISTMVVHLVANQVTRVRFPYPAHFRSLFLCENERGSPKGRLATTRLLQLMKITSSAFEHNQPIPSKYTCDGENINPPLAFEDIPVAAESLVLIVDDPDAPNKTWVHWVLYNMSSNIDFIKENSKPGNAEEGITDFGKKGWGGPCPPSGTHRYFFRLYALDSKLEDMPDFADKEIVLEALHDHVLEQAELIGTYAKK
jgi:Raf kinase inhibitor-like YbhB/YbcL family protein